MYSTPWIVPALLSHADPAWIYVLLRTHTTYRCPCTSWWRLCGFNCPMQREGDTYPKCFIILLL